MYFSSLDIVDETKHPQLCEFVCMAILATLLGSYNPGQCMQLN